MSLELLSLEKITSPIERSTVFRILFSVDDNYKSFEISDKETVPYEKISKILDDENLGEKDLTEAIFEVVDNFTKIREKMESVEKELNDKDLEIGEDFITYKGEALNFALESHLLRLANDSEAIDAYRATIKFMKKLFNNDSKFVRKQLYTWLKYVTMQSSVKLTIAEDGDFIAYKGCEWGEFTESGEVKRIPYSINRGYGIVDGVEYNGAIPNYLGAIVSMPRKMVENNPYVGCSEGLHAGTWDYAKDFARGVILAVKIDPRDVVSIPTDCSAQKLRVSRYKVVDIVDQPLNENYYEDDDNEIPFEECECDCNGECKYDVCCDCVCEIDDCDCCW